MSFLCYSFIQHSLTSEFILTESFQSKSIWMKWMDTSGTRIAGLSEKKLKVALCVHSDSATGISAFPGWCDCSPYYWLDFTTTMGQGELRHFKVKYCVSCIMYLFLFSAVQTIGELLSEWDLSSSKFTDTIILPIFSGEINEAFKISILCKDFVMFLKRQNVWHV